MVYLWAGRQAAKVDLGFSRMGGKSERERERDADMVVQSLGLFFGERGEPKQHLRFPCQPENERYFLSKMRVAFIVCGQSCYNTNSWIG